MIVAGDICRFAGGATPEAQERDYVVSSSGCCCSRGRSSNYLQLGGWQFSTARADTDNQRRCQQRC
eukprot:9053203-Alexandrium_andersonii.AAC.1